MSHHQISAFRRFIFCFSVLVACAAGTVGFGIYAVDRLASHTSHEFHGGSLKIRQLLALRESYGSMADIARDLGDATEAAKLVDQRRREHEAEALRLLQRLQSQARPGGEQDALARIGRLGERYIAALAASTALPGQRGSDAERPPSSPSHAHALQFQLFEAINEAHDQQQALLEQLLDQTASESRHATRLMTSLAVVLGLAAIGVPWAASSLIASIRSDAAKAPVPARPADTPQQGQPGENQNARESQVLESIHLIRQTLDELVREVHCSAGHGKNSTRSHPRK